MFAPPGASCANWKNVKLEVSVIVEPELTAIMMRFDVFETLISVMNHRPDSRSNRTCGSLMPAPPRTELKNVMSLTFSEPRFPSLSNTLKRPFAVTSTCVGPTAPLLSGGMAPDSESRGPRKSVPMVWGVKGPDHTSELQSHSFISY